MATGGPATSRVIESSKLAAWDRKVVGAPQKETPNSQEPAGSDSGNLHGTLWSFRGPYTNTDQWPAMLRYQPFQN